MPLKSVNGEQPVSRNLAGASGIPVIKSKGMAKQFSWEETKPGNSKSAGGFKKSSSFKFSNDVKSSNTKIADLGQNSLACNAKESQKLNGLKETQKNKTMPEKKPSTFTIRADKMKMFSWESAKPINLKRSSSRVKESKKASICKLSEEIQSSDTKTADVQLSAGTGLPSIKTTKRAFNCDEQTPLKSSSNIEVVQSLNNAISSLKKEDNTFAFSQRKTSPQGKHSPQRNITEHGGIKFIPKKPALPFITFAKVPKNSSTSAGVGDLVTRETKDSGPLFQ